MSQEASSSSFASLSLQQVLDDLSSRFIVNLPDEELESIERICFSIEQAHWFYEDFVRPQASHLPSLSLRKFSELVFQSCPLLSDYDSISAYDQFLRYKERVPVCGAILINTKWDKCLIVKGWKSGASWSFPRGKINHGETERDCAVREVWEETGYDISPHFNPHVQPHEHDSDICPPPLPDAVYAEDDWIECVMKEQRIRLYIVPDVPEDTLFETKTRKEISKIAWAPFTSLPTWSRKNKAGKKELKCYMVTPFVNPMKEWLRLHRGKVHPAIEQVPYDKADDALHATIANETFDDRSYSTAADPLHEESSALQAYFFGSQADQSINLPPFEPSSSPNSAVQTPNNAMRATMSAATVPLLSPIPQSAASLSHTVHRLMSHSSTPPPASPAPLARIDSTPSSGGQPRQYAPASTSRPDHRDADLMPGAGAQTQGHERPPVYFTEAERQVARSMLLKQMVAELDKSVPRTNPAVMTQESTQSPKQVHPLRVDLLAILQDNRPPSPSNLSSQPLDDIHSARPEIVNTRSSRQAPTPGREDQKALFMNTLNGNGKALNISDASLQHSQSSRHPVDQMQRPTHHQSTHHASLENGHPLDHQQSSSRQQPGHSASLLSLFNGTKGAESLPHQETVDTTSNFNLGDDTYSGPGGMLEALFANARL